MIVKNIIKGLYCNESAYLSLAQIYNIPYYPLALRRAWNFEFNDNNNIILGEKISHGRNIRFIENEIKRICGIESGNEFSFDTYPINDQINTLLQGGPLFIIFDLFWCKWTRHYQRNHTTHIIIIISHSQDNNGFYCVDTNFSNQIELLDYDNLNKGYLAHVLFSVQKINNIDTLYYFKDSINYLKQQHFCKDILSFNNSLKDNFNYKQEFDAIDAFDVPLIREFYLIKGGRLAYNLFLEYIHNKLNNIDLTMPINLLSDSINDWDTLLNIIQKSFLRYRMPSLANISSTLNNIYAKETEALELIMKVSMQM